MYIFVYFFVFQRRGERFRTFVETNESGGTLRREKSDSVFVGFSRERRRGPARGKSGPGKNK